MQNAATEEGDIVSEGSYDTSDPTAVNAQRRKVGRKQRDLLAVVGALMEQKEGRAWLYHLLDVCHCFETSYVPGDVNAMLFREGERNVGLRILSFIQSAAPHLYAAMVDENRTRGRA